MKGSLIIIIVVLLIIMFIVTKKAEKDVTVVEEQIEALDKTALISLAASIKIINDALMLYFDDINKYPDYLEDLYPRYITSESQFIDPWGTKFDYKVFEDTKVEIISAGKDRVIGNQDDIIRRL